MRTVLVTGPIGSGKSAACRHLEELGYPVYSCDARTKALYDEVPGLKKRIEDALGIPFGEIRVIFKDEEKRRTLESIVYPLVVDDIRKWTAAQKTDTVFVESAIALEKRQFDGLYDKVLMITAPMELRRDRNPETAVRDALQDFTAAKADWTVVNDSTMEELNKKLDKIFMKTDLARILSVSGHHGLYQYVAQARNGAIAETLADKKRTVLDGHSRITTLEDIAIYTSEGEMRLAAVFTAINAAGVAVPTSKDSSEVIRAFFDKAIPNYDADRFYVSHMKKVLDWYGEIAKYASLDFMTDEDREKAAAENGEEA